MAPFTQTFLLIHLEPPDNSLPLIYQVTPSSLNDPTRLFSLKMFPNHWSAPGHKPPLMKSGMEVVSDTLWLELFPPSPHCWQRVNKGSIVTPSIELLKLVLVFGSWKYHFFPGLLQANDLEPWFLVFICFFFNNSPAHAVRRAIITWTAWPGQCTRVIRTNTWQEKAWQTPRSNWKGKYSNIAFVLSLLFEVMRFLPQSCNHSVVFDPFWPHGL